MLSRNIPITDHRGRPFTLWPHALTPQPGAESRADARLARRIVWKNIDPPTKRRIRWLLIGGLLLIIGLTVHILLSRGKSSPVPTPFFWAFYFIAAFLTTWRAAITARSASICTALLSRNLCPSCGYNLSGLTPDHDGCTTCPECGAAWRIPAPQ